ncbi:MAG: twin-arginine translocation signal domain-containing protein [Planctomycetes bacterium]|nr:twin-arginine translocation signal domain-containing protein [Planctomycetota bacterium]
MDKKIARQGQDSKLSRRDFVGAAAAVAAFTVVPRHVLGGAGNTAASSNFGYSGPFTETVVMDNLAVLHPEKVLLWDGENKKVTNGEQANAFVRSQFRAGWSL